MRIGIVVCTYNNQKARIPYYIQNIFESLRSQKFDGQLDVLFCDNISSERYLNVLREACNKYTTKNITFSYISEPNHEYLFFSLNLGFYTLSSRHYYDVFAYSADDVWLENSQCLSNAINEFSDKSVGIVSTQANFDHCPPGLGKYGNLGHDRLIVKLGECVNLHFMLFSREFMESYEFRYPDTISAFGNEATLTFLCAAIDKIWILSRSAPLINAKQDKKLLRTKKRGIKGFHVGRKESKDIPAVITPGISVGMGFQSWLVGTHYAAIKRFYTVDYDHSLYDENEKCINKEPLFNYIKKYLFLDTDNPDTYRKRLKNIMKLKRDLRKV